MLQLPCTVQVGYWEELLLHKSGPQAQLPSGVVESLSLEAFKNPGDVIHGDTTWWTAGLDNLRGLFQP